MSEERTCRNCAYAVEEWSPKYEENMLFCHCEGMPKNVSFDTRFHGKFCCNQWKPKDGVNEGSSSSTTFGGPPSPFRGGRQEGDEEEAMT